MAKTIQDLRQQLIDISRELAARMPASDHDDACIQYALDKIDAARQALFECKVQA